MKRVVTILTVLAAIGLVTHRGSAQFGSGGPPKAEIGRYQMSALNGAVYVLDTATGQCWGQFSGQDGWKDLGSPARDRAKPADKPAAPAAGTEKVNGVDVKVGDPQFTLTWDSKADLDLHVIEPGGSEIYWESRNGKKGGVLDVDTLDGRGAENIYWKAGPAGEYRWFVHYYGLGGNATPSHWKVRIKTGGKETVIEGDLDKIGQKSPVATVTVEPKANASKEPR